MRRTRSTDTGPLNHPLPWRTAAVPSRKGCFPSTPRRRRAHRTAPRRARAPSSRSRSRHGHATLGQRRTGRRSFSRRRTRSTEQLFFDTRNVTTMASMFDGAGNRRSGRRGHAQRAAATPPPLRTSPAARSRATRDKHARDVYAAARGVVGRARAGERRRGTCARAFAASPARRSSRPPLRFNTSLVELLDLLGRRVDAFVLEDHLRGPVRRPLDNTARRRL